MNLKQGEVKELLRPYELGAVQQIDILDEQRFEPGFEPRRQARGRHHGRPVVRRGV